MVHSQKDLSTNEKDSNQIQSNLLYFDSDQAKEITQRVFAGYKYTVKEIDVTIKDNNISIKGLVALRTKNNRSKGKTYTLGAIKLYK